MDNTFRSVGLVALWSAVGGLVTSVFLQVWWETEPLLPTMLASIVLVSLGSAILGSLVALTFLDPGHDES